MRCILKTEGGTTETAEAEHLAVDLDDVPQAQTGTVADAPVGREEILTQFFNLTVRESDRQMWTSRQFNACIQHRRAHECQGESDRDGEGGGGRVGGIESIDPAISRYYSRLKGPLVGRCK